MKINSKNLILFRNEQLKVQVIDKIDSIYIFENLDTYEIFHASEKEMTILKSFSDLELDTIQTELIEAIISRKELINFYTELDSESVLISISDIDKEPVNLNYFKDSLFVSFNDTEENIGEIKVIDNETAKIIKNFILKHKNDKFVINCEAGISRSAAVGYAIECLLKFNGNKYDFAISNSEIRNFHRYSPNMIVFDRIINS